MKRRLATIQEVINIAPIEGADMIERADVLGWQCVVKKGQFKPKDLICYVEIDSLLPKADWSEFLWKKGDEGKPVYRLRTCKLRGQISQGLVLPMSVLAGKKFPSDKRENPIYPFKAGMEVTGMLGIEKYEAPIPAQLAGLVKGSFPSFIPKTDEMRIQAVPEVLAEIAGKPIYITVKCDGSSATYYWHNGEFGVCSRNLELKDTEDNTLWQLARKYKLAEKLAATGRNLAIQAEATGPGIQKNRMGLKEHTLWVFNVYDISMGRYLDMSDWVPLIKAMEVPTVPVVSVMDAPTDWSVKDLEALSKGVYEGTTTQREGIVIRPLVEAHSAALKGRLSFKCINPAYLLAEGE